MIIFYYLSKYVQHNTKYKYIFIHQRKVQYIFFHTHLRNSKECVYISLITS
jgi:hypothetical protein